MENPLPHFTRRVENYIKYRPRYPQVARWKGTGSTDDAANFACVTEAPTTPVRRSTGGQR